ncbi:MAG: flagellar biosynthesis protein [Lachnospiraceae bacterium]|nr:flagellar biosynthesis protein [Lachnospiraceae bacterium]
MPEQIQNILNRIIEWWKKFNTKQRVVMISILAVVIVALVILGYAVSRPTMVTLITCETAEEATSVKELLEGADPAIAYTTDETGMKYSVNQEDYANANILLGTNKVQSDGYSIDDAINGSFSTTEADKQKKYKLYLEDRFATQLATIEQVDSAKVTLSLPENDGTLLSEKEDAYANVILSLKKELDENQAAGIAQYIATGLGNDNAKNILILDSSGNVLFSGGDESTVAGQATSNLTAKAKAQAVIVSEVKNVLLGTDVYDNVDVGMNLVMNFDKVKETNYDYSVDEGKTEGYLDSETSKKTKSTSGVGGVPGTDTNDDDTTYVLEDNETSESSSEEFTKDYLPDEKITETEKEVGTISYEDSSISVVATSYVVYDEDKLKADGTLDDQTFDEFVAANSDRVKTEVDEDFINLVSKATGIDPENISIVAYDIPMFQYSEGANIELTDILQIVLAVLILAMLGFVVLRTLRGAKEEEEVAEQVSVETLLEAKQEEQLEDIGFSEKSEARILIEKFVDENPEAVANLLRNWLNEDWG